MLIWTLIACISVVMLLCMVYTTIELKRLNSRLDENIDLIGEELNDLTKVSLELTELVDSIAIASDFNSNNIRILAEEVGLEVNEVSKEDLEKINMHEEEYKRMLDSIRDELNAAGISDTNDSPDKD